MVKDPSHRKVWGFLFSCRLSFAQATPTVVLTICMCINAHSV